MLSKRKIILFGAGSCGRRHAQESTDDILCFVDNDNKKQGTVFLGHIVVSPEEISNYDYDSIVIASIYESEIRRQLVQMGLGDKISTQVSRQGSSGMVPVNFNTFDCHPEKIAADAQYALNVASGYVSKLKSGMATIRNKHILELGPGINFGTALTLLVWGAKSVTISDRFLTQYDSKYHSLVYQALVGLLTKDVNADCTLINQCIAQQNHKIEGLVCVQSALEELCSLFPNYFDITLSNAVFEHLYHPVGAFESLFDTMAKGAIGCHQVDFRDHRDFKCPLEFLLLDELSFHALMNDACCEFGNRVRPFQMQAMFENAGFSILNVNENMFASDDYLADFLPKLRQNRASSFAFIDSSLLKPTSANFLIAKN